MSFPKTEIATYIRRALDNAKSDNLERATAAFRNCTPEQKKENKHTQKNHFAPFNWVPTDIALWYAAGFEVCAREILPFICSMEIYSFSSIQAVRFSRTVAM